MKKISMILIAALTLTSCSTTKNPDKMSNNNLAAQVSYGDKIANKVVFEGDYKMIVFALKEGQELKPHSAPMDAPLLMLEGSANVSIGNTITKVVKGDMITLPKDIKHGVSPLTNCKFLLLK